MNNRQQLRQSMRARRRALTPVQQTQASQNLLKSLRLSHDFLRARRVALYLANDGEIDPMVVAMSLWRRGCEVYLPVLHPVRKGWLVFVRYTPDTPLRPNRYGIAEPVYTPGTSLVARFLDVVCLPLVAFDEHGNRLGMGGGYYDRTFAFTQRPGKHPRLIGCAHECQRVDSLKAAAWDIPLSAIATDGRYQSAMA